MRKTVKSKLLQLIPRQPLLEVPSAYISLTDMGLSGDLHPPYLMIVMRRHVVGQTTYDVVTSIKYARWFSQGIIRQQPVF